MPSYNPYPRGAAVVIDGRETAYVVEAFPEGSTSFHFPHVRLQRTPVRQTSVWSGGLRGDKMCAAPPETFCVAFSRVRVR